MNPACRTALLLAWFAMVTSAAARADETCSPAAAKGESAAAPAAGQPTLGQQVDNFELRDFRGKSFSLAELQDRRAVVVVFLGVECPLATLYAPRLVQLAERFADQQVAFVGIDSNAHDAVSEMADYAETHGLTFPLLKDVGNVVADALGAERTPEVFVLDAERRVRYRGRIDDQYLVGRQRPKPTREDLAQALTEILAGNEVSTPTTPAVGCRVGRVHRPAADARVTFTRHVAPLLNAHCVACHRPGEIAPFALTSYEEVSGWADTILEVVDDNRMPPWHANPEHGSFSNDCRLSDADKKTLHDWVQQGAAEGNPADLPEPPQFAEGWRLPRVDQIVYMTDAEHDVPAEGTVAYQYFTVDPGFTEDKWVQGAECRPGNRAVVHHVLVGFRGPDGKRRGAVPSEWLSATAPGARPMLLPDGMAKFVPAGAKLVFQMHYTPNGSPQKDRSSIGLMFADAKSVRREVGTLDISNPFILIPPGSSDYWTEANHTFKRDTILLSLFPHMHLRGKAFRYEAHYPDGQTEVLLDVPRYDFNWQNTYELTEPKLLPKGTKLRCVAHYDNSPNNLANPNPKRAVFWGDQTWEEMMIGYVNVTPAEATGPAAEAADVSGSQPGSD
ncbi:MAG: thioredoxin family protein [Pirellulales bacterium]